MSDYILSSLDGRKIRIAEDEIPIDRSCPIDKTQLSESPDYLNGGRKYNCVTCNASYPHGNNEISEEELNRQALIYLNSIKKELYDLERKLPAIKEQKSKLINLI